MPPKRNMSTRRRAKIFEAARGICHICEQKIDGVREAWDADHIIPLEIGGDDTDGNMRPAHKHCHRDKTSKQDAPTIAKAKRVHASHNGAKKSRNPLPGSRDSAWKQKMDGTWERR